MKKNNYSISLIGCFYCFFVLTFFSFQSNAYPAPSDYFDTVQEVFIGYYQRPAGPSGLIYWANRLSDSGGNLSEIIEGFANSAESRALYGTINSGNISSVVTSIFEALFNRAPAQAGLNYYVNGFNSGQFTAATIMLNILNGAQNQDLQSVNNKVTAANLFTRTIDPDLDGKGFQYYYSGNTDAQRARDFLLTVTWDPATIPTEDEIKANLVPMTSYAYTLLRPEGWGDPQAHLINDNGQVVGWGHDGLGFRGFLYSNGTYTTLLPEGWRYTKAYGINNSGQVVGYGYDNGYDTYGQYRNFLYSNGTYTILPLPEGCVEAYAYGINNNGQVVGFGCDASYPQQQCWGFLYSNGTYTLLLPKDWVTAYAYRVNDNGEVVGDGLDASRQWRFFLYSNGTYTTIVPPEGWVEARATGINDNGQVVGYKGPPNGGRCRVSFTATAPSPPCFPRVGMWRPPTGSTITARWRDRAMMPQGSCTVSSTATAGAPLCRFLKVGNGRVMTSGSTITVRWWGPFLMAPGGRGAL